MAPTICSDEDHHVRKRIHDTRKRFDNNYTIRENNSIGSTSNVINNNDIPDKIGNRREHHSSNLRRFISINNINGNNNLRGNYNLNMNNNSNDNSYDNNNSLDNITIDATTGISREFLNENINSSQSFNSVLSSDVRSTSSLSSLSSATSSSSSSNNNLFCDRLTPASVAATVAAKKLSSTNSSLLSLASSNSSLSSAITKSDGNENSQSSFNNNNSNTSCDSLKINTNKTIYRRNHPYFDTCFDNNKRHYNNIHNNHQYNQRLQQKLRNQRILLDRDEDEEEVEERENNSFLNNTIDICNKKSKLKLQQSRQYEESSSLSSTSTSSSLFSDDDFDTNETKIRAILQQKLNLNEKNGGNKCDKNFYRTKGLVEIAIKTIKLIRRNQMLQRKLHQLQLETNEFVQSVMSNHQKNAICTIETQNIKMEYDIDIDNKNQLNIININEFNHNNNNNNNKNCLINDNKIIREQEQIIKHCIDDNSDSKNNNNILLNNNNNNINNISKNFKLNQSNLSNSSDNVVVDSFKIH